MIRALSGTALSVLAAVVFVAPPAFAQGASQQTVAQFLANPAQLLQQHSNGGAQLISAIRDLALADPATLSVIVNLLSSATADQAAAIGSGLGQAAQASIRTNPNYANEIQQAIAASGNQVAQNSFAGATGNVATGASGAGGAGGGGGGGVGGPTGNTGFAFGGSNSGGGVGGTGQSFQTSQQTFTGGGGTGTGGATNSSVSPR
jgi:hypothetical protein